jgi:glycosyltransferase involved in cell wall biosynthesis
MATIYNTPNLTIPEDVAAKSTDLLGELGIDSDAPIVGTASRLSQKRGVHYFVEAAASIWQAFPEVRFVIAGGGTAENELRRQATDLHMGDRVVFLGPRRDMERVYSIMDVFVNPCPDEPGTGNTNAEAMAFGKPVVAVNRGGTPELVQDGITGFTVPPRDAQALAQATLRLLRNRDLANRMGMAGRERILKDFRADRLVLEVEEVYSGLLERR